ncbi:MAG: FecR domain-containing protein [Pirellulales bacterium]
MSHVAKPKPVELERMLSALVDGTITADEQAVLDRLIATDPAVRAEYRDFMRMEHLLAWEISYGSAAPVEPTDDSAATSPEPPAPKHPPAAGRRGLPWRRAGVWLLPLSLAAAVAGGIVLAAVAGLVAFQPVAATLTDADGARWNDNQARLVGASLGPGPLHLTAGSAQITFRSGAVVTLESPAEFDILGSNKVFLRSGRLTPFVPPAAKGFTVVSPTGEVIDFGTEFSVAVDPDGKTDVFVIHGEVDVKKGHGPVREPVRLTQGYATRVAAGQSPPQVTQTPLIVDHFDAMSGPLARRDIDPALRSTVRDGGLWIPINGSRDRPLPMVQSVLGNDFSAMVGRRSAISMKVTLPRVPGAAASRWLALVVDDGTDKPPRAGDPRADFAVILSQHWQVGTRYNGTLGILPRIFVRDEEAVGPYQVVVTIDDSPAAHAQYGSATVSVIVNGRELVTRRPFKFNDSPRLTFQTWDEARTPTVSHAVVDDFSVSVDVEAEPAAAGL